MNHFVYNANNYTRKNLKTGETQILINGKWENENSEKFKLIDSEKGVYEYTGSKPFEGTVSGLIGWSGLKTLKDIETFVPKGFSKTNGLGFEKIEEYVRRDTLEQEAIKWVKEEIEQHLMDGKPSLERWMKRLNISQGDLE